MGVWTEGRLRSRVPAREGWLRYEAQGVNRRRAVMGGGETIWRGAGWVSRARLGHKLGCVSERRREPRVQTKDGEGRHWADGRVREGWMLAHGRRRVRLLGRRRRPRRSSASTGRFRVCLNFVFNDVSCPVVWTQRR
ncbi:putative basic proline-rich protein-like [Iris pallida]|uniref:Basic proline-rich protein-like n=1 Tax=Iris pallida TaxID=29817 RepID=A0AAX6HIW1_IRIPA|nr:putative basic proline-rich protein-like [Iris pallida]